MIFKIVERSRSFRKSRPHLSRSRPIENWISMWQQCRCKNGRRLAGDRWGRRRARAAVRAPRAAAVSRARRGERSCPAMRAPAPATPVPQWVLYGRPRLRPARAAPRCAARYNRCDLSRFVYPISTVGFSVCSPSGRRLRPQWNSPDGPCARCRADTRALLENNIYVSGEFTTLLSFALNRIIMVDLCDESRCSMWPNISLSNSFFKTVLTYKFYRVYLMHNFKKSLFVKFNTLSHARW